MAHHDRLMRNALGLAARGMFVFPLRPGRKTPALSRSWEARATTDPEQIERWWVTAPYNIGVATGPSHLLVIDLDSPRSHGSTGQPDGRQVFRDLADQHDATVPRDTFSVATAGGGLHLYFRVLHEQLGNSAGRLGPHVDSRARGGYVVGPGSTVDGRPYRILCAGDPTDAPGWLIGALRTSRSSSHARGTIRMRRGGYVDAAVAGEIRNVGDAPVGRRNHVLYVAAARLGRFVVSGQLTVHDVRAALETAAARHVGVEGFTFEEVRRTIESGLRRGTSVPRSTGAAASRQARFIG
ncbi:bifunctional DNA primase/polymerase [Pseudonocardia hydrocarbonoxydans]|uniref:bifunctional DNA primase/polymerase n=1 Tax=Pseudonocardia hydrocarbonoxydans TaxID=76726 RepID=UPI0031DEE3CD